jgi:hypothetical protein
MLWASRFAAACLRFHGVASPLVGAALACSRRAIRSITFALRATVVPLLSLSQKTPKRSGSLKANRSLKDIHFKKVYDRHF